eukprot:GILK01003249.1.p1 GENE.GILK01003249.1~~GILK01003249.1.p1  ORF type:complete len:392 (+),score=35.31 GILK01003249.1:53-1228(+)
MSTKVAPEILPVPAEDDVKQRPVNVPISVVPTALPTTAVATDEKANLSLTEDRAKLRLIEHVHQQSCYKMNAAIESSVSNVAPSMSYDVELTTFFETRDVSNVVVPYPAGAPLDNTEPVPDIWVIHVPPSCPVFKSGEHEVPVPHTDLVCDCTVCRASGKVDCETCSGAGNVKCVGCKGSANMTCASCKGHKTIAKEETNQAGAKVKKQVNCDVCHATGKVKCGHPGCQQGRLDCNTCQHTGKVECSTCTGHGKMKQSKKLTVKWLTVHDSGVVVPTRGAGKARGPPDADLSKAQGDSIVDVTKETVTTEADCEGASHMHADVLSQVKTFLKRHTPEPNGKILQQKLLVRTIPVYTITYLWHKRPRLFWVYGKEQRVFENSYPQTCSCSLM